MKKSGNTTANLAAQILIRKQLGFVLPTAKQKRHLVVAFAKRDMIVYGKAFDILRLAKPIDLNSLEEVEAHLDQITLYEIKSTKQDFNEAFDGYFFGLTAAEVLVAQSLKKRFQFVFVNTLSGSHLELTLSQIFARARGIYPTWSISF
ncbi:MAG: hypothetical protein HZA46_16695 [Planctomycetales bacterium]|nr:hypothetical protein [Planctomycetales bacterium]